MTAELTAPVTREVCRLALDAADLAAHHGVRRSVFVDEQHVFAGSDHDGWDDDPRTLHVVGLVDGRPSGSVRLYPLGDGEWKGDRLAVLPGNRAGRLGVALVRFAVATAGERGGSRMIALVQAPNEVFFRRLGWSRLEALDYVGRPHVRMEIALG
jgi:putative N-acetyltransferase (TIGR04045 family)